MIGLVNAEGIDPEGPRLVLPTQSYEGIVQVLGNKMGQAIEVDFLRIVGNASPDVRQGFVLGLILKVDGDQVTGDEWI